MARQVAGSKKQVSRKTNIGLAMWTLPFVLCAAKS